MNEPVRVTVRVACDGANAGCTLLTEATASTDGSVIGKTSENP